jgi:hypothetical protein
MLTIRDAQLQVLSDDLAHRFTSEMIEHVRALDAPALRDLAPTAVADLVARGIALARRHGIDSAWGVRSFLEVAADLGADFETVLEETGVTGLVLADASLPGDAKVELVWIEIMGRPPEVG